jgi:hypothetical protein
MKVKQNDKYFRYRTILTPVPPTETAMPGVITANFPAVNCCKGNSVSSGLYRFPTWQGLPLVIEVTGGWRVMNEEFASCSHWLVAATARAIRASYWFS